MRNVFKVVSSVASAALLLSGAAMAAPPTPFGGWSVNNAGVISGVSPSCVTQVVGAGFLQCQEIIGGKTYIQTIIAEGYGGTAPVALANLTFRSQDFVQIGAGSVQGLASSMGIKDSTTNAGTTFGTTANILTGWAVNNAANQSEAVLDLSVTTPGAAAGAGFSSTFGVTAVTTTGNVNLIEKLSIGQMVELGLAGDKQRFELRNEPAAPAITGYTIAGGTGVLNAALNNPLQGLWVAQSIAGTGSFNVQSLSNLNGGANSFTSATSLVNTGPVDWSAAGGVFFDQFGGAVAF